MNNYLTFDVGTTSVKACIFSSELELISSSKKEYSLETVENHIEVDPAIYTSAITDCVRELKLSNEITAISITTQGETLIPVDENGNPLGKAIVWLDNRATAEAFALNSIVDSQRFYEITGLPEISSALPLTKLMWLKNNKPEIWNKTHKILLLEDYLLYWLSGRFVTEKSLATSTGWFDINKDSYSSEMLSSAKIEENKLPELIECGTVVGNIIPERAAKLGLSNDVLIVSGAMDQTAAAYAAGCTKPGYISETTGTAMVAAAFTDNPTFKSGHHLTIYRSISPKTYIYLPISNTAGMSLKWLRDNILSDGNDSINNSYKHLDELAEISGPGANGVLFLPYLAGECDPETIENATATFFGMTLATNKGDLARAVMEAIAYQLKDFINMLKELDCPISHICSLGGGAYSPLWLQIKADICGLNLYTLKTNEATSLGVAALALKATTGRDGLSSSTHGRYEPKTEFSETYNNSYIKYQMLNEVLKKMY